MRSVDFRTALCVLCAIVTVVVVAPTVLTTSSRTSDAQDAADAAKRAADAANHAASVNTIVIAAIARESAAREREDCRQTLGAHNDRRKRLHNLRVYLRTPAGREGTLFNQYIRAVSLPQLRQEVQREGERIPPTCRK